MEKTEVIVDTCFLQKISSEGRKPENIKKVLDELGFTPVAHPYICEHELSLHSYACKLIENGYIRKIEYCEFIKDQFDKQYYEDNFNWLYEDLRLYLQAKGGPKQMGELKLPKGKTIYDIHLQGNSIGDVHTILMAAFMGLPVILTEDSDIELLKTMAKRRISIGKQTLTIFNAWDLVQQIAANHESVLTKKELEQLLNDMGERKLRSEMKTIYNKNH